MPSEPSDALGDAAEAGAPSILVACDDYWMGQLLAGLLGDVGYHTLRFSSGVGLLERLQSDGQPCVVLLSLRGPPIASRAILEAVAAGPPLATRHAYIVLTALWDMLPSDYISLLTQLAVPVVPKPFQMDELLDTVAEAAARLER